MEGLAIALLVLVLLAVFLAVPVGLIIALVRLQSALGRIAQLESQVQEVDRYLRQVSGPPAPAARPKASKPSPAEETRPHEVQVPAEGAVVVSEAPLPLEASAGEQETARVPTGEGASVSPEAISEEPIAESRIETAEEVVAQAPADRVDQSPPKPASLEERIGLTWLTRIGAGVFILGAAFFLKYAVDNDWIGPMGRVAIGAAIGLVLLGFAEQQRPRSKPQFVHALTGVGLALLLVTAYASFAFYDLVPVSAAFAAVALLSLLGGALALRHRAQVILIIALLAAFANPILLSTGQDRPLALFTYLFVMTAAAIAVSLRAGFGPTIWLAVAGVVSLWIGWYARFFDARPPPEYAYADLPPEQLTGAYYTLASRIVPLAAVVLFSAAWAGVSEIARRRERRHLNPTALLVTCLVVAHGGLTFLLYDHRNILGLSMLALAVASVMVLQRLGKTQYLLAPLGASFLALMICARRVDEPPYVVLAIESAWGAVYAAALLLREGRKLDEERLRRATPWAGIVLAALALLSAVLLVPTWNATFEVTLVVLSIVACVLGAAAGQSALLLIAAFISLGGLFVAGAGAEDGVQVMIAGAWAAVYLAASGFDLLYRRAEPSAVRLLAPSLAGLGFLGFALVHMPSSSPTMNGVLAALVGFVDLGFGVGLRRAHPSRRGPGNVFLGQALACFTASLALLHSGVSITVFWAALAAVVLAAAASSRDPAWLAAGIILSWLVILRLLAVDTLVAYEQHQLFLSSLGRDGALAPRAVFNPRALAMAAATASLFIGGWQVRRVDHLAWRVLGAVTATMGHIVGCALIVIETRRLMTQYPAVPELRLDAAEFEAFREQIVSTLAQQEGRLGMVTTLMLGIYAIGLLIGGFAVRSAYHRYLGLAALTLTLGKLALWDVWNLARLYQIVVLVAVGALLLGAGFLYARFGKRLLGILEKGTVVTAIVLAGLTAAWPASALDGVDFHHKAVIDGVTGPGYFRVVADPALYRATETESALDDLRVTGPSGEEAPYVIRAVAAPQPAVRVSSTMLDQVTLPDGRIQVTLETRGAGARHTEVDLTLDGYRFFRGAQVEISDDGTNYGTIARGSAVYRVEQASGSASCTRVRYALSKARYVRVTILPGEGDVALTGASLRFQEWAQPEPRGTLPLSIVEQSTKDKQTLIVLDAAAPGVPFDAIDLDIADGAFDRRVTVTSTNYKQLWPTAGTGWVYRAGGSENLRIDVAPMRKRWQQVRIDDGDDKPLQVRGATASYRLEEIVFRAERAGAHALLIGAAKASAPRYDLAAVMSRAGDVPVVEAKLGPLTDEPAAAAATKSAALPWSERFRAPIGVALSVVVLGLALWTWRLLKRAPGG